MFLRDMISLLGDCPIAIEKLSNNADILFVEALNPSAGPLAPDTLYYRIPGAPAHAINADWATHQEHLSLLCGPEGVSEDALGAFDNIIHVPSSETFGEAFAAITKNLQGSIRLDSKLKDFLDATDHNDDLNVLAQWLSDFFEHPVNIVDANFTYLAHSNIEGFARFGSDELMKDILNGYVSPDHIEKIQQSQGRDLFRDSSAKPVLIYSPNQGFHQYHVPILIGRTMAGSFSVYLHLDERLDPLMELYLERFARIISIEMQRADRYTANKASFYTSFFSSLLEGATDSSKMWEKRLAAYGYSLQPSLHLVAARVPPSARTRAELQNLAAALQKPFANSIYYIHDSHILLLCSNAPGRFRPLDLDTIARDFLERNSLKVGISSEFDSIYDMASYYSEALAALDLGERFEPTSRLYLYDNLRTYDMVSRLAKTGDIASLCYPPFMRLFQHDEEHGTDLGRTLYTYLSYGYSPAETCQRLHIHRNTLYYRLDKIRSIMGVDITKLSVSTQVSLTIVILRYLHQIDDAAYELSASHFEQVHLLG